MVAPDYPDDDPDHCDCKCEAIDKPCRYGVGARGGGRPHVLPLTRRRPTKAPPTPGRREKELDAAHHRRERWRGRRRGQPRRRDDRGLAALARRGRLRRRAAPRRGRRDGGARAGGSAEPPVAADARGLVRRLLGTITCRRLLSVHARLPLRDVRRRHGRLPDVPAARRGRVPRVPLVSRSRGALSIKHVGSSSPRRNNLALRPGSV